MIRFRFRARGQNGELRKGIVEAQTVATAAEIVRGQKLTIIELVEAGKEGSKLFSFMDRVSVDDVVIFTRQLATMIAAGLPLTNAMSILQTQTSVAFGKKIADILKAIEGGSTLADAMSNHSDIFSKVYLSLIGAGEKAGLLDTILVRLADNLEKQREFRAKTKGALIYPVIVLIGMLGVTAVMMIMVLPKLSIMYEDFGAELPIITKVLMDTANFMNRTWYLMAIMIVIMIYGVKAYYRTKSGILRIDQLMLRLPIFGKIKMMTSMAEFARTLALLLSAGVALVEGLKIVRNVMDSEVYGTALDTVTKDVERGNTLAVSLARHSAFPMIISQMSSVGEQTGKLDEILNRLAVYFETESEHAIKNLSTAMEPIIMIVLGVGVTFLILAIVVPIYNLTSAF